MPQITPETAALVEEVRQLRARVAELGALEGEYRRASDEGRAQLDRVQRQQAAIIRLVTHEASRGGDLGMAARVITEVAAETLNVQRVGIRFLSEDRQRLECVDLFDRSSSSHSAGITLEASRYPCYFEALVAGRAIDASDACHDPRTREFTQDYFVPMGIASTLDAPIRMAGEVIGIICCEHAGTRPGWHPDEIRFAAEVADQVAHVLALSRRRDAERALLESEQKYRSMIDAMDDLVYICSPDHRIEYMNQAMIRHVGRDATGELCYEVVHQQPGACPTCAGETPQAGCCHTWEMVSPRDDHTYHVSTTPFRHADGRVSRMAIVRDITEVKQAEEHRLRLEARVRNAQKLESLGVLAGGIAHDFSNLLVGILGNASLALGKLPPASSVTELIHQIEKAACRASDLTRQLLAYSGKGKFVVEPVHLSRLVREMASLLRASISKKAVLEYDFASELPLIEADATQLRQVVMNLITNASETIGDRGGWIRISTGVMQADRAYLATAMPNEDQAEGQYVYVEVADTGQGMDAQTAGRIFDPFFTTKFSGRGLGLAAVMGIVRGHRGAIRMETEPGRGTTFRVLFPVPDHKVQPAPARRGHAPNGPPASATVLVVDDEEIVRSLARRVLEDAGFTVLEAVDGREGLDLFAREKDRIDVVLLDLTMPQFGGEEVFREMQAMHPGVRVVLTSGYSEQEATDQFAGSGLTGFLQKPYRAEALVQKLLDAME